MKPIWKRSPSLEELNRYCRNTLISHLGIQIVEIGPDFLVADMPVTPALYQTMGIVHGGANAALAETVGSLGANLASEEGVKGVGLELNINHIRAVREGIVRARGTPVHLGRSTQVWEIRLFNGEALTAISRLTVSLIA